MPYSANGFCGISVRGDGELAFRSGNGRQSTGVKRDYVFGGGTRKANAPLWAYLRIAVNHFNVTIVHAYCAATEGPLCVLNPTGL